MSGWDARFEIPTEVGFVRARKQTERRYILSRLGPGFDPDLHYDLVTRIISVAYWLESIYGLDHTPVDAVVDWVRDQPDPEGSLGRFGHNASIMWSVVAT